MVVAHPCKKKTSTAREKIEKLRSVFEFDRFILNSKILKSCLGNDCAHCLRFKSSSMGLTIAFNKTSPGYLFLTTSGEQPANEIKPGLNNMMPGTMLHRLGDIKGGRQTKFLLILGE